MAKARLWCRSGRATGPSPGEATRASVPFASPASGRPLSRSRIGTPRLRPACELTLRPLGLGHRYRSARRAPGKCDPQDQARQAEPDHPSADSNGIERSSLKRLSTPILRAIDSLGMGGHQPIGSQAQARSHLSSSVYHTNSGKNENDAGMTGRGLLPRDVRSIIQFIQRLCCPTQVHLGRRSPSLNENG